MPVGAAIGSAVVGAGTSIYGSKKAKKASKNALQAQLAQQERVWGTVNPFLTAGTAAQTRLDDPNKSFMASPDYKFRMDQSLDAVTTNKAVNGLLRSGSALNAVTSRAGDLASGEFGNWWNRQSGIAARGLDASRIGAGLAGENSRAISTDAANQGNSAIATANALGTGLGSIIDIFGQKYGNKLAADLESSFPQVSI